MKNLTDKHIVIIGILIGLLIQVNVFIIYHDNPIGLLLFKIIVLLPTNHDPAIGYMPFYSDLILLFLPMIPALIMTLYRPRNELKWLLASTISLLLSEVAIDFPMLGVNILEYRNISYLLELYIVIIFVGCILSLLGVILGWGLRKLIQLMQHHQKVA